MCLAKVCCCNIDLKEGAIGIAVVDSIIALIILLFTIIMSFLLSLTIEVPSKYESQVSSALYLFWFTSILFIIRAFFGLVACSRSQRPARFNFFLHVIIDVTWILNYIIVASFFWLSSSDLSLIIINFALNGYFDWILYSVWKTPEVQQQRQATKMPSDQRQIEVEIPQIDEPPV